MPRELLLSSTWSPFLRYTAAGAWSNTLLAVALSFIEPYGTKNLSDNFPYLRLRWSMLLYHISEPVCKCLYRALVCWALKLNRLFKVYVFLMCDTL